MADHWVPEQLPDPDAARGHEEEPVDLKGVIGRGGDRHEHEWDSAFEPLQEATGHPGGGSLGFQQGDLSSGKTVCLSISPILKRFYGGVEKRADC
jgi:hypothetical protein